MYFTWKVKSVPKSRRCCQININREWLDFTSNMGTNVTPDWTLHGRLISRFKFYNRNELRLRNQYKQRLNRIDQRFFFSILLIIFFTLENLTFAGMVLELSRHQHLQATDYEMWVSNERWPSFWIHFIEQSELVDYLSQLENTGMQSFF